jgi:hypothetical protein
MRRNDTIKRGKEGTLTRSGSGSGMVDRRRCCMKRVEVGTGMGMEMGTMETINLGARVVYRHLI